MIESKALLYKVNSKLILDQIDFKINSGQFIVVVGENGSGKTTLLQMLMGIIEPTSGSVTIWDHEPYRDPYKDRDTIGYISEKISPPMDWSIGDFLEFNRTFYSNYSQTLETELMKDLRLQNDWKISQLSAGQTRRIQVVGALSAQPKLLFIDEITAVLDIVGRAKFMKALEKLRRENGTTVVMATNILDDVDSYATEVILLHQGKLLKHSSKSDLIAEYSKQNLTETLAYLIEKSEGYSP
ncbi:MAG: ABC transporter ATP-binding protein [Xanthomonadaceae bacterium]|nr:ABC transporter ATP-binding protein [Xanthomonadaceae bacterium]